jgi:hypothetical protein
MKVTTQYWKGDVRVCELEAAGRILDIHMSRSENQDWIAEAHADRSADGVVIVGTGGSRSAALRAVAVAWAEKASTLGLQEVDWNVVTDALRGVNAAD